jgi:hypothetical protein
MVRTERIERFFVRVEVEERVAWLFRNVGSRPPHYTMSYPRRPQSESSVSYFSVSSVCAEDRLPCVFIETSKFKFLEPADCRLKFIRKDRPGLFLITHSTNQCIKYGRSHIREAVAFVVHRTYTIVLLNSSASEVEEIRIVFMIVSAPTG